MPLPQLLTVDRHDRSSRALITLAGEIDLESEPLLRVALERGLLDGIRAIDVDLTLVTFCDCSGLNAFLRAAQEISVAGGTLRLHHPPTTLVRILEITGCGFLLVGLPFDHLPPPLGDTPPPPLPAPPHRSAPLAPVRPGDAR